MQKVEVSWLVVLLLLLLVHVRFLTACLVTRYWVVSETIGPGLSKDRRASCKHSLWASWGWRLGPIHLPIPFSPCHVQGHLMSACWTWGFPSHMQICRGHTQSCIQSLQFSFLKGSFSHLSLRFGHNGLGRDTGKHDVLPRAGFARPPFLSCRINDLCCQTKPELWLGYSRQHTRFLGHARHDAFLAKSWVKANMHFVSFPDPLSIYLACLLDS